MNSKEHQAYLKDLKTLTDKLLASKEASQKFYISAGIHDEKGNLSKMYVSEEAPVGYQNKKNK